MATERINGIKFNPERLSDTEVMTLLDNQTERLYRTEEDTRRVLGWATMRGLVNNRPADDLPDNVIPFPTSEQLEIEYDGGA